MLDFLGFGEKPRNSLLPTGEHRPSSYGATTVANQMNNDDLDEHGTPKTPSNAIGAHQGFRGHRHHGEHYHGHRSENHHSTTPSPGSISRGDAHSPPLPVPIIPGGQSFNFECAPPSTASSNPSSLWHSPQPTAHYGAYPPIPPSTPPVAERESSVHRLVSVVHDWFGALLQPIGDAQTFSAPPSAPSSGTI